MTPLDPQVPEIGTLVILTGAQSVPRHTIARVVDAKADRAGTLLAIVLPDGRQTTIDATKVTPVEDEAAGLDAAEQQAATWAFLSGMTPDEAHAHGRRFAARYDARLTEADADVAAFMALHGADNDAEVAEAAHAARAAAPAVRYTPDGRRIELAPGEVFYAPDGRRFTAPLAGPQEPGGEDELERLRRLPDTRPWAFDNEAPTQAEARRGRQATHEERVALCAFCYGEGGLHGGACGTCGRTRESAVAERAAQAAADTAAYEAGRRGEQAGEVRVIPASEAGGRVRRFTYSQKNQDGSLAHGCNVTLTHDVTLQRAAELAGFWAARGGATVVPGSVQPGHSRPLTPAEQAEYEARLAEAEAHEARRLAEIAARPDCPNCGRPGMPNVCPACGTERIV